MGKKSSFSTISTGVFERTGTDAVSTQKFYTTLAGALFRGLGLTAIIAHISIQIQFIPNVLEVLLLGLALPILGIWIAIKSKNPIISFLGYNMIVIPFGLIIGPSVNQYSQDIVRNAFGISAITTILMGVAGTLFPDFFKKIGQVLFFSLSGLLIVLILQRFIPSLNLSIFDYIGAGIFSLYIGYDMYRANALPKTIDNAIDVAINFYLDIINLFLFILRILGRRK